MGSLAHDSEVSIHSHMVLLFLSCGEAELGQVDGGGSSLLGGELG